MNAPPRAPRSADGARPVPPPREPGRIARDAAVLALTLRAEAETRPVRALEALASLAVNRGVRGGAGLEAACRDGVAFSCWSPGHPRHARLRAVAGTDPCRRIARRAAAGTLPDATGGATHWHGDDEQPAWSLGQVPSAEIGGLLFYRLDGTG